MADRRKTRRVLFNDDGWIMGEPAPLHAPDLKRKMIEPIQGTGVDALLWSVGGHEVYHYETIAGERFGEGYKELTEKSHKNVRANLLSLIDECGGPLTCLIKLCHEAGMDFFPSLRINTHYQVDPASPAYGRMRRDHPEWLIGHPGEDLPEWSMEWGVKGGLDFAQPAVRNHVLNMISELVERFDTDGIELDFMRQPTFFRIYESYSNRYLMTDLVRRVKAGIEEVERKTGRHIDLAIRVTETIESTTKVGLDVVKWLDDSLIDILIVGSGFNPFDTGMEEYVKAAQGNGCQVYGVLEALRPAVDEDVVRAIAARHWSTGADGLYMFNYQFQSPEYRRRIIPQIANPQNLEGTNKLYMLEHTDRVGHKTTYHKSFRFAIPVVQLPITLEQTLPDGGPFVRIYIADNVAKAADEGKLESCTLTLRIENLQAGDELGLCLNWTPIPWNSASVTFQNWNQIAGKGQPWHFAKLADTIGVASIAVDPSWMVAGWNTLEFNLVKHDTDRLGPAVLRDVEVAIKYK